MKKRDKNVAYQLFFINLVLKFKNLDFNTPLSSILIQKSKKYCNFKFEPQICQNSRLYRAIKTEKSLTFFVADSRKVRTTSSGS